MIEEQTNTQNFLTPEDVTGIYLNDNMIVIKKMSLFIPKIARELNISLKDLKESVLGFTKQETEEEKTLKPIAMQWNKVTEKSREATKDENPDLNYEKIQQLADEIDLKTKIRLEFLVSLPEKFYQIFQNSVDENNKPIGLFKDFVEIIDIATPNKIKKEQIENSGLNLLVNIFISIFIKVHTRANEDFLLNKAVNYLFSMISPTLNSIKTNLSTILKGV